MDTANLNVYFAFGSAQLETARRIKETLFTSVPPGIVITPYLSDDAARKSLPAQIWHQVNISHLLIAVIDRPFLQSPIAQQELIRADAIGIPTFALVRSEIPSHIIKDTFSFLVNHVSWKGTQSPARIDDLAPKQAYSAMSRRR
jgi:hypothetical protein